MWKSNNKFYLRGIISASATDNPLQSCDTKKYSLYTDVAKFKDWILSYVENLDNGMAIQ